MRSGMATRLQSALGTAWRREVGAVAAITALAAAIRLPNLPARGLWDADQGVEMDAMYRAVETMTLPTFGPEAISVEQTFHHGALYYDLLLPAVWLGRGDPTFVVAEIALLSLLVIPIVWWMGRTMAGPATGLIAALLAAVSASLAGYAIFVWNPTLVEPAAAVAFLGAWQAWRTRNPRWWVVAAAGTAVAAQSHIAATITVVPMTAAFAADFVRGVDRRRVALWGAAGVALFVAAYLPVIIHELTHGFSETNGVVSYLTGSSEPAARDPFTRVLVGSLRVLAWPLTRWPIVDLKAGVLPALAVALCIVWGLLWRLLPGRASTSQERDGVRFTAGLLLLTSVVLSLGLKLMATIQELPTEQYHSAVDPLVIVAAALVLGALWRSGAARPRARLAARGCVGAALVFLCTWNALRWPPLTSFDGGWPAAERAADRIQEVAGGDSIALVPLFEEKGTQAYAYPLRLDGVELVAPDEAGVVVLLCDRFWLDGCGGEQEEAWRAGQPDAARLTLVDRFDAAPDRVLSIYRRAP